MTDSPQGSQYMWTAKVKRNNESKIIRKIVIYLCKAFGYYRTIIRTKCELLCYYIYGIFPYSIEKVDEIKVQGQLYVMSFLWD